MPKTFDCRITTHDDQLYAALPPGSDRFFTVGAPAVATWQVDGETVTQPVTVAKLATRTRTGECLLWLEPAATAPDDAPVLADCAALLA